MTKTDNRFFTNEPDVTLLDRFKQSLKDVQFFDVLVGYFQTSGFNQLYESFEDIEKIRILVGLGLDKTAYEIIEDARGQIELDFTYQETRDLFSRTLVDEIDKTPDTSNVEIGISKFIDFLTAGKIEIKAHRDRNIHAKVYISRFKKGDRDFGRVITGSSNFSYSGLVGQNEFNVELKDRPDVDFALEKFERLWADAIDVTEDYINTVQTKTWLNDKLQPYFLYLKTIYEYFKEDINIDRDFTVGLPEGFLELDYQKQATTSALKIIDGYNGVFLSDVVGLGKTYISALVAKQLKGQKLVLCPPPLKDYWRETFRDFDVTRFDVESIGKIDSISNRNLEKFEYIFIDEAHRFRNQETQTYAQLRKICAGKKVILVTATPFNNDIDDILSQLSLFQIPKRSLIPGVSNLDRYFKQRKRRLKKLDKGSPEYYEELEKISAEIRENILKYVMVRRTRSEIVNFFTKDIAEQGLAFPEIKQPHALTYQLGDQVESVFEETIELLRGFSYARYTPFLYLKRTLTPLEEQQQKNVRAFMKILLVKRLESSFYAFKNTVDRFVESYSRFMEMFDSGKVYITKKVNVFDYLDNDREDEILELVEKEEASEIESEDFLDGYREKLQQDLIIIRDIQRIWADVSSDPKLSSFITELKNNEVLKGKKAIIFTEAAETGEYLYQKLISEFDENRVLFIHGGGGVYQEKNLSPGTAKEIIRENFDPMCKTQKDDIQILVTTDVLAEGINLHRSNIVINYDLPWNPTRILQRVGRVNRVGTEHQSIQIFNYFPTEKSEVEIHLEDNVKAKLQAFHNLLGEDAKYLTEEEEVGSFEIFGGRLIDRLQSLETYTGEEVERSELEYLTYIREIRDENPDLFEQVKWLPKKARSGKRAPVKIENSLITFIRKGLLKKFFMATSEGSNELPFLDAMELLRCKPEEEKLNIPKEYFELLEKNKISFDDLVSEDEDDSQDRRGRSNVDQIISRLKTPEIKHCQKYTDEDEAYIREVRSALEDGRIPKKVAQRARKEIETEVDPLKVLNILQSQISSNFLIDDQSVEQKRKKPREVILSVYLKEGKQHEEE